MLRTKFLATVTVTAMALAATACGGAGATPTATLKAYHEALKRKDVEAVKKTLSRASLQTIEVEARLDDETLDEAIKTGVDKTPSDIKLPETRNLKIKGDTAMLEIKDDANHVWFPMKFVKEDGRWKIAADYAMRDPAHRTRGQTFVDKMPDK